MGAGMLRALRAGGFDAQGFDVRPPSEFGDLSANVTDDLTRIDPETAILISVVRDIAQTEALLFDDQALTARLPYLGAVLISSTVSPRYITDLSHRLTCPLIDAPMSGAQIAADEARLSFMLGGPEEEIEALMPLFQAMGRDIFVMGDTGAGMQAKVLNNLLAGSNTVMTRLVLDWAQSAGVDPRKLLDVIHASSGQNWLASGFEEIEFATHGFDPENTLGILKKDIESALDAAPEDADRRLPEMLRDAVGDLLPFREG